MEKQSVIDPRALAQFLSGRAVSLGVLLGFQVLAVRLLPTADYARYALVLGLAALAQTITGVGLPRVAARFLSQAGEGLGQGAARRLAVVMLGLRLLLSLILVALAGATLAVGRPAALSLLWPGAAYALASAVQLDADGMAQALGLQRASRRAVVGEPALRLIGLGAMALGDVHSAEPLLWISAATAALAAAVLLGAVFSALSDPAADRGGDLDWKAVRRVAAGGYGGTLSWLAFSPGVVRVIASRVLPVAAFAGFAFAQTLVVSLQRYAPSFVLFPLVEPLAMADAVRKGGAARLRAALSLLVKLDAVLIGAVIIGVSAAGGPIVRLLTHGRYGGAAVFLPWLLLGVVANASHRSYEIAAIAVGAAWVLARALGLTLVWLALTVMAPSAWGVWPLLLCPLGDALTRLWLIDRALAARDGERERGLIDPQGLAMIGLGVAGAALAAAAAAQRVRGGLIPSFAVGTVFALGFLAAVVALAPFDHGQRALLAESAPWLARWGRRGAVKRVWVLTPRGFGGTGGVDRLMDSLRPLLAGDRHMNVRFLTTRGASRWLSPLVTFRAILRLATACALHRCDLIHVNLGSHGSCYRKLLLLAAPRRLGTPYLLHLHGSAFEGFWSGASPRMQRRIDRLFQDAAQVVVLGEGGRALLARRLPGMGAVVLPNAAPPLARDPERASTPVQILFLGELGPRKGAAVLIEALGRLNAQAPWRAVLAGDGDVQALRRRAAALDLLNRVEVLGWAEPPTVEVLLARSHILALPSFEETLPMAVIEAFGAGLAVVATPVGAVPEIVIDGQTGLLVPPGEAAALACALQRLVDTPALRRRLGAAGAALHSRRLSIGPYASRLQALWRQSLINPRLQEETCAKLNLKL